MIRGLVSALAVLVSTATATVSNCDTSSVFKPTLLAMTPDPPVRGQLVSLTVQFDNPGPAVSDGTATTSLVLNGLPFSPSTDSLCKDTLCPIESGFNDRSSNSTWPADAPLGKYVSTIKWTGPANENLMCVQIVTKTVSSNLRGTEKALIVRDTSTYY
jgi:hypothetical protein